jgi:D-alanyl-D-alanine carboxypeptidase
MKDTELLGEIKMKKGNFIRYIAAALVVLALVACAPFAFAESEAAPETKANNVMVVSLNTGATIYQKNAKQKIYPASTTKLMTMAVALEMIDNLDEEVVFDRTAAYADLVVGSSNMGLKDGEKISLHHMMYGIALSSANEGTNMVAIHLCGSIEAFVKKMNQKAAEWGMKNTHYVNTHGLTDENHYTTAEDMAIWRFWPSTFFPMNGYFRISAQGATPCLKPIKTPSAP